MNAEFDKYAKAYSHLVDDPIKDRFVSAPGFFHRRKHFLIRDFLARKQMAPSRMSWLDIGCGKGELLHIAGSAFARVAGCDPSLEMVKECRGIEVLQQPSPIELPFPGGSFDLVTAVCVYHHVDRAERHDLTCSVQRVLKREGIFCIIEHNPWNPMTQLIVRRCPLDVDAQLLTSFATSRLMLSAGLRPLEKNYFLYLPERLFARVGWMEDALRSWPIGGQFALFARKP